jgi:hypothetical protein
MTNFLLSSSLLPSGLLSPRVLPSGSELYALIFPAALLVFYLICWARIGRDPRIGTITPQYEPPVGVTPGVARYILTGGSDGTTLASVIAGLAEKKVISVEPTCGAYRVAILRKDLAVMPEEAAFLKTLLGVEVPITPYPASKSSLLGKPNPSQERGTQVVYEPPSQPLTEALVDPAGRAQVKYLIDALQNTFRGNLNGIYFRQNMGIAAIGMLATLLWALYEVPADASTFVTFWLFLFTTLAGLVIGGYWTSRPTRPTRQQRISLVVLPLFFFLLPGALIYFLAMPKAHGFVLALLLSVMLNSIFFVIMRAPTALGLTTQQHLAGFREFLVRVEQDRLERVNTPEQKAELMNRFLPYAIALNVREGWGDKMAGALSDAVVER